MQPGFEAETNRLLAGAELWVRLERDGGDADGPAAMVAGWEDGHPPCAPFVAADGRGGCSACPTGLVAAVLRTGHAALDRCPFGIRMLAFPAPAGARDSVAVLRIGAPDAVDADLPAGRSLLHVARRLRGPRGLAAWQADQRARGAERRRTAAAALEQMIATTEEFHRLYTSADRDRTSSEQAVGHLDSLARETLRESEEARTRIAHTLHDTAGASINAARRFVEAARASLAGPRPESARPHLDSAEANLVTALDEVRAVLNTLVPPNLEELGLADALRRYVEDTVPGTISAEVTGKLPRAEGWLEGGLFAMTVEAIGNAVQHAGATRIRIDLHAARGRGIITVTDDGIGFDPAAAHRRTIEGMGLIGMARRASWLGGRVDVTSRPGAGTSIRISVPLDGRDGPAEADATTARGRERS